MKGLHPKTPRSAVFLLGILAKPWVLPPLLLVAVMSTVLSAQFIPGRVACPEGARWIEKWTACVAPNLVHDDKETVVYHGTNMSVPEWLRDPRCWYYLDHHRQQWFVWKCE